MLEIKGEADGQDLLRHRQRRPQANCHFDSMEKS